MEKQSQDAIQGEKNAPNEIADCFLHTVAVKPQIKEVPNFTMD